MEVVFGICTATAWHDPADSVVGPAVFGSIVAALGVIGLGSFGSLFCFHVYLLGKGYGTIDFIMERAMLYDQQQKARFQEAAAQQSQRTLAQAGAQQTAAGAAAAASVPAPQQQLEIVVAPAWAAQALAAADATTAAGDGSGQAGATTAGPRAGLSAPAPDQATASMVQLAEPAAAAGAAAVAAAPGPRVEATAAGAPAARLPAPVAQAALTSHCISQEEQDEIAAEIEAGRRAIEASRARFRAGNPADSGSLFQAAQAVGGGGYGVGSAVAGVGVSGAIPSSNTAGVAIPATGSGIAPAAAHSSVVVVPPGAAGPDAPLQLPGAMPPSARAAPAAELSSHGYGLSATKQWLGLIAQESADTRSAGDASAAGSPAPTVASVGSSSSAHGACLSPDSYQLLSATGSATHSLAPDALQTGTGHDAGSPAGIIANAPLQPSAATAHELAASASAPDHSAHPSASGSAHGSDKEAKDQED